LDLSYCRHRAWTAESLRKARADYFYIARDHLNFWAVFVGHQRAGHFALRRTCYRIYGQIVLERATFQRGAVACAIACFLVQQQTCNAIVKADSAIWK